MKKLISFTLLFCLIAASSLMAQSEKDFTKGGGGYFSIGYGNYDVGKLQDFLPEGTEELSNDHLLIGGGGHSYINNFIIGGSGLGISGSSISNDSLEANTSGGMGFLDLGYMIVQNKKIGFYPLVGIGAGGFGININELKKLSLEDVRNDPGRAIEASTGGLMLDFSLNFNFYPLMKEEDGGYGGLLTGLEVGYNHSFYNGEWEHDGGTITNGPDFNLTGFYAKLTFGGIGFHRE